MRRQGVEGGGRGGGRAGGTTWSESRSAPLRRTRNAGTVPAPASVQTHTHAPQTCPRTHTSAPRVLPQHPAGLGRRNEGEASVRGAERSVSASAHLVAIQPGSQRTLPDSEHHKIFRDYKQIHASKTFNTSWCGDGGGDAWLGRGCHSYTPNMAATYLISGQTPVQAPVQ